MRPSPLTAGLSGALALAAALSGCATDDQVDQVDAGAGPATGASVVDVTATDDGCVVSDTSLAAGPHTFEVTNDGSEVTEFYVYEGDRVLQEVEDIGPGLTRELRVELAAGEYRGVCKPGMSGDGIATDISVAAGSSAGSPG